MKAKIIEIVIAAHGRECWRQTSGDERDEAILAVQDDETWEVWERAASVRKDEELNQKYLDPEYVCTTSRSMPTRRW